MSRDRPRVYVTRRIPEAGIHRLQAGGYSVEVNPQDRGLSHAELLAEVPGRDAILCLLSDRVDASVLDAAKNCRVFANYAVGYDNIDLAAARRRGVAVTNTPGVLTDATAEQAWALLFAAARRVVEADRFFRGGSWDGWGPLQFLGRGVRGKTLGVVGAGRIGTAFALMSRGFEMQVLYHSRGRSEVLESVLGAREVGLDELLARSDFVSLHVPLGAETRHMIGASQLALMKSTAILINTSRGPVVDEAALVRALGEHQIAAAGLDVFENEPRPAPGLTELANVVCVPHLGSATLEARTAMAEMAADNILAVLAGAEPPNRVA